MTKRVNSIKRSIKQALHECEIYAANDFGMSEREFMRLLVETTKEVSAEYININAQVIETYNPQHVQDTANRFINCDCDRLELDDEHIFFTGK